MQTKPLEAIVAADIDRLVENGVAESSRLDYKLTLPRGTDEDKKEFLADVSAFANTVGGDIVFGVEEAQGLASRIVGVGNIDVDSEGLRLESMLRDGIEPRLPGVRLQWISGPWSGPVLVLRVPRSWAGPHMVAFKQSSRFYARNSAGKHQLDVTQIRRAFLESGSLSERAREFRSERIGRLVGGEAPVALTGSRLVCVHVLPHSAIAGGPDVDLVAVQRHADLPPLYGDSCSSRFNLDGLLAFVPTAGGPDMAYLQLFRNGAIETASSELYSADQSRVVIWSGVLGRELIALVERVERLLTTLGVEAPVSIFLSLIGLRGATFTGGRDSSFNQQPRPFDRDVLLFRELLVPAWGASVATILRPLMDEVSQAAGLERSRDYDGAGQWRPR